MKVECRTNNMDGIPSKFKKYAFTQDENGSLDLTIGKQYSVYGIRRFDGMKYYLVLTDSIHNKLPWWMPATLFEVIDDSVPTSWTEKKRGLFKKDTILAPPSYHNHENNIEDGGAKGVNVFVQMQKESGY